MKKLTMVSFVVGGRSFTSFIALELSDDGKVRWTTEDMDAVFRSSNVNVPRGTTITVGS